MGKKVTRVLSRASKAMHGAFLTVDVRSTNINATSLIPG